MIAGLTRRLAATARRGGLRGAIASRARYLRHARGSTLDIARNCIAQPMVLYVDVVGVCNLACPSCPVGNSDPPPSSTRNGTMSEDLLDQTLRKALSENVVGSVGLFNWTEPLLHPRIEHLIARVKSFGLPCDISTNLNVLRDPDALLRSGVDEIRVSVSGFHQATYARTHALGNIETVKANMRRLSESHRRLKARTRLTVSFHKYVDNLTELDEFRAFAQPLGFTVDHYWAYLMPVEHVLDRSRAPQDIDRLLPLRAGTVRDVGSQTPAVQCALQDQFMTLDVQGHAYLCCASARSTQNRIGSFLDVSASEIVSRKKAHRLCSECMAHGLPAFVLHENARLDALAAEAAAGTALLKTRKKVS